MKNRIFSVKPADLAFQVVTPKHEIRGYSEIELKTRSVLGIIPTTGTPEIVVFAKSVPISLTVGEATGNKKNAKRVPAVLPDGLSGLHEQVKLVDVTLLNRGAQVALTTAHSHPEDTDLYKPLYHWEKDGWVIQLYRVFLYRYDQLKNDHFIEVVLTKPKDHPAEKPKTIHFYVPTKSRNISIKDNEVPYEDLFAQWVENAEKRVGQTAELRTFVYTYLFGGRKEGEFPDKQTKKYQSFTELRNLMQKAENRLGNTTLSVFCSVVYWFWLDNGRDTLENDMIGYYGKKFYSFLCDFVEADGANYPQPGGYDFSGKDSENL